MKPSAFWCIPLCCHHQPCSNSSQPVMQFAPGCDGPDNGVTGVRKVDAVSGTAPLSPRARSSAVRSVQS